MADPKFSRRAFSGLAFALAPLSAAEAYVSMLRSFLPPGRLWTAGPDSVLGRLLFAFADEIWRVDVRSNDLIEESHPETTVELLPEYERELALAPAATVAERQANVVAHLIRRQRYRPIDFQTALASLLGQAVGDVVVIERSHAFAVSIGDDREIFRFFIYRNPASPGTYFLASAQELVEKMKPSHTLGHVIESISFLADDPFSLTDRDLLGV